MECDWINATPDKWVSLNINSRVRFRMTDAGWDAMNESPIRFTRVGGDLFEGHLWEVMRVFGAMCMTGKRPLALEFNELLINTVEMDKVQKAAPAGEK